MLTLPRTRTSPTVSAMAASNKATCVPSFCRHHMPHTIPRHAKNASRQGINSQGNPPERVRRNPGGPICGEPLSTTAYRLSAIKYQLECDGLQSRRVGGWGGSRRAHLGPLP